MSRCPSPLGNPDLEMPHTVEPASGSAKKQSGCSASQEKQNDGLKDLRIGTCRFLGTQAIVMVCSSVLFLGGNFG